MSGTNQTNRLLINPMTLRITMGVLAIVFPFVLLVWGLVIGSGVAESISHYYDVGGARDVLVGVLFTVGWYLLAYKGHPRRKDDPLISDNAAGNIACWFALGIALFPVTSESQAVQWIHHGCAIALFLTLAYFCLRLFVLTDEKVAMRPRKESRNKVYRACGWTILACIAAIALYHVGRATGIAATAIDSIQPVFWLETLALVAFGVSWFVKGQAVLGDKPLPA